MCCYQIANYSFPRIRTKVKPYLVFIIMTVGYSLTYRLSVSKHLWRWLITILRYGLFLPWARLHKTLSSRLKSGLSSRWESIIILLWSSNSYLHFATWWIDSICVPSAVGSSLLCKCRCGSRSSNSSPIGNLWKRLLIHTTGLLRPGDYSYATMTQCSAASSSDKPISSARISCRSDLG